MLFRGLSNEQYIIGNTIGKGGEGQVFEITNHPELVFKKYNDIIDTEKVEKLQYIISRSNSSIVDYATMPIDIVMDEQDFPCGFVMKKLKSFVPLHTLFSPMDRKKLFPDKGYNFLLHVARNIAVAFHKMHEAGWIIGDVNEGNLLVNGTGLVSFIDCDSFQCTTDKNKTFYCEVGVPRYTPPELLKKQSFKNIIRTINTDSFSLAILIFQLLFLGRHPFAGINTTNLDIDEETAIKTHEFAYSLQKQKKKLTAPKDSFNIESLNVDLIQLFHTAFEEKSRPLAAEWAKALDAQLNAITICEISKLHTYPNKLTSCPWCEFKRNKGIYFFLDDNYLNNKYFLNDIDQFVNGFKIENLTLKPWDNYKYPSPQLTPTLIDKKFIQYKYFRIVALVCSISITFITLYFNYQLSQIIFFLGTIITYYFLKLSKWNKLLKLELDKRQKKYDTFNYQLFNLIEKYNSYLTKDTLNQTLKALETNVMSYKQLPNELQNRIKLVEELLYNEQLGFYLSMFYIENAQIPSIGVAKKAALKEYGIVTAAQISLINPIKVPGLGPKNWQHLICWRQELINNYIYIPNQNKLNPTMQKVNDEMNAIKNRLEQAIKQEYQNLNYIKNNVSANLSSLEQQIIIYTNQSLQSQLDYEHFKKFYKRLL